MFEHVPKGCIFLAFGVRVRVKGVIAPKSFSRNLYSLRGHGELLAAVEIENPKCTIGNSGQYLLGFGEKREERELRELPIDGGDGGLGQ